MEKLTRRGLCPGGKRGSTPLAGVLLRGVHVDRHEMAVFTILRHVGTALLSGYAHRLWI